MKKIVSVLVISALTFGSVFAKVSVAYETKGYALDRTETKVDGGDDKTTTTTLDQDGYADASSDVIFQLSNDVAGVVLDLDPSLSNTKDQLLLDEYYGWLTFGSTVITSGLWTSRYVRRVNADAGEWEGHEFERYKPGVANGAIASDVDNITKIQGKQRLATAAAYTLRSVVSQDDALLIKGVIVDGHSTTNSKGVAGWGSLNAHNYLRSGLALEVAYRNESIDVNAVIKSMAKEEIAAGLFVRFFGVEGVNALAGVSFGKRLNYWDAADGWKSSDSLEWGVDLRARYKVSDDIAVTTMLNISSFTADDKSATTGLNEQLKLWFMVSGLYTLNETIDLQLTLHYETILSQKIANESDPDSAKAGSDIELVPGVIFKLTDAANITTGVIVNFQNLGAAGDYKKTTGATTSYKIPVIFNVSL